METKADWTLVSVGLMSIGMFTYYFFQNQKNQEINLQELKRFQNSYRQASNKNQSASVNTLKSNKAMNQQKTHESDDLVCMLRLQPKYNESTFKLYERERNKYNWDFLPSNNSFRLLQNQMGGDFEVKWKDIRVRCRLDDFIISNTLFQETKRDVHLFKDFNELTPIVEEIVTTLRPTALISIYGKLFWDESRLEWTAEPRFITSANEFFPTVRDYYNSKISSDRLVNAALIVGGLILSYFSIVKPLSRIWKKRQNNKKEKRLFDGIEYFKNKDYITVKKGSLLNCEKCNARSVEIIYECGHLAICEQCHDKNIQENEEGKDIRQCILCHKESSKFLKVFLA